MLTKFRTRKTALFLAYVAAAGQKRVSRDTLVSLLWPEHEDAAAKASLSTALNAVRSACTSADLPQILEGDRECVYLIPGIDTDLAEFDRLTTRASVASETGESIAWLRSAIGAYLGPFLSDFEEDWILLERQFRSEEYVRTVRRLIRLLGQSRASAEAIRIARDASRKEPLRESLTRDLMRLLWRAGEPAAALGAYASLERTLRSSYDLSPSERTTNLADEISEALAAEPPNETSISGPTRPISRFVGRTTERNLIRSLLSRDDVRLVTVVGFGGVGKSRLAREIAADLIETGEREAAWIALDGYTVADSVWTAIAGAFGIHGPTEGAVLEFLGSLRHVLIVDNAEHLIPEANAHFQRILDRCPFISLLVTSRVPLRSDGEHLVRLGPLADDSGPEAEDLLLFLDRFLSAHPGVKLTDEQIGRIRSSVSRLGGIPLAIEMVAASVPAELIDRLADLIPDVPNLSSGRTDHQGRHELLAEVIYSTIAKLSGAARRMLDLLWVFDAGFSWESARLTLGGSSAQAMSALQELQDFSVVYAVETRYGHRFMTLRIVREVMQATAPEPDQVLSVRWAIEWLNLGTSTEACLGYISREITRNAVREADNIIGLANHAHRLGQFDLAADALTPHAAAFKLSDHTPTLIRFAEDLGAKVEAERGMQLACMASSLVLSGLDQETWPTPIVDRFVRLADESADPRFIAVAYAFKAYRTAWHYEDHPKTVQDVDRALAIDWEQRSPATSGLIEIWCSEALQGTFSVRRAMEIIERMYDEHGVRPGLEEESYLARYLSACIRLSRFDDAIPAAQRLRELAWESESFGNYSHSFYFEGFALLRADRVEQALPILEVGIDVSRKYVPWDANGLKVHQMCAIYGYLLLGRLEEAWRLRTEMVGPSFNVDAMFGIFAGDTDRAVRSMADACGREISFSHLDRVANTFDYSAAMAYRLGNVDLAQRLAGHADSMREECGTLIPNTCRIARAGLVPAVISSVGPDNTGSRQAALAEAAEYFKSLVVAEAT